MEASLKVFERIAVIILGLFVVLLLILSAAYVYSSLNVYNALLVSFIAVICLCIIAICVMCFAIIYTFKRKKTGGIILSLTKLGLRSILPVALFFSKTNSQLKKSIRYFYIELNNIVVESDNKRYRLKDIMLLLPHCLQNNECGLKVTNNPHSCRRCGRCKIGELVDYAEKQNISIFIATGGTVARNIIKKNNPKLIISVACERDLMSGISDVRAIPVIGVTNKQPNGPCYNTDIDIKAIKKVVEQVTLTD